MHRCLFILLLVLPACAVTPQEKPGSSPVATFSIVGFDPDTGELGVAVQSKVLAVGAIVPWARADVGAVATQAWANTTFGPAALEHLKNGKTPEAALAALLAADRGRELRQVAVIDAKGRVAQHTGARCTAWAGHKAGKHYAVQGNLLAGPGVIDAMADAFEKTEGPLGARLIAALTAGQGAGGDKRGRQSAALLVVRRGAGYSGFNDRYRDLRVDDHPEPIKELARLYALHRTFFGVPRNPPR